MHRKTNEPPSKSRLKFIWKVDIGSWDLLDMEGKKLENLETTAKLYGEKKATER